MCVLRVKRDMCIRKTYSFCACVSISVSLSVSVSFSISVSVSVCFSVSVLSVYREIVNTLYKAALVARTQQVVSFKDSLIYAGLNAEG